MGANVNEVWRGMTVYGSDGTEIGAVHDVYIASSDHPVGASTTEGAPGQLGSAPGADDEAGDENAAPGSGTAPNPISATTGVAEITVHTGGFLGIGGDTLHIPGDAIASVRPGDSVTLACAAEECRQRFG